MFIAPITPIGNISEISTINNVNQSNLKNDDTQPSLFKDIFTEALDDYKTSEAQVTEDIYKLASGESDDLHTLMINMEKSEMALDLFVQLRNKALDAYKEIMNTNM